MFLLVTLPNIYRLKKISLHIFQIWLTITHLKYVGTQPCNLSLRACFTDINVSQDSVATYERCDGIFTNEKMFELAADGVQQIQPL